MLKIMLVRWVASLVVVPARVLHVARATATCHRVARALHTLKPVADNREDYEDSRGGGSGSVGVARDQPEVARYVATVREGYR